MLSPGIIIRNIYSVPILERGIKCQQVRYSVRSYSIFNHRSVRYMAWLCRYTSSYFLHACFVHANHRMRRFRNSVVNFQHRFHLTYECRIRLFGNAPHTFLPRFYSVFLMVAGSAPGKSTPLPLIPPIALPTFVKFSEIVLEFGLLQAKLTNRALPSPSSTREPRKRPRPLKRC